MSEPSESIKDQPIHDRFRTPLGIPIYAIMTFIRGLFTPHEVMTISMAIVCCLAELAEDRKKNPNDKEIDEHMKHNYMILTKLLVGSTKENAYEIQKMAKEHYKVDILLEDAGEVSEQLVKDLMKKNKKTT